MILQWDVQKVSADYHSTDGERADTQYWLVSISAFFLLAFHTLLCQYFISWILDLLNNFKQLLICVSFIFLKKHNAANGFSHTFAKIFSVRLSQCHASCTLYKIGLGSQTAVCLDWGLQNWRWDGQSSVLQFCPS